MKKFLITQNFGFLTGRRHMGQLAYGSVGLTYEQSAVKIVVRVLRSGTVFYKTHAHLSLLNVTFVCSCLLIYSV